MDNKITALGLGVGLDRLQIGHCAAEKDLRIIMKIGKKQELHVFTPRFGSKKFDVSRLAGRIDTTAAAIVRIVSCVGSREPHVGGGGGTFYGDGASFHRHNGIKGICVGKRLVDAALLSHKLGRIAFVGLAEIVVAGGVDIEIADIVQNTDKIGMVMTVDAEDDLSGGLCVGIAQDTLYLLPVFDTVCTLKALMADENTASGCFVSSSSRCSGDEWKENP